MFQSMTAGDIKACWIICTNPVASTFGAGDPPDNGESFWQALQADNAPRLPDLRYAVLGFGDSSYDLFCGFARNLDIRLEQLGAQRLRGRVDCDTDFEEQANEWIHSIEKALTAGNGSPSATTSLSTHAAEATATVETKALATILWASQTGNAEGAANSCAKKLQAVGHDVRLACMDSYSITDLSKERLVLMVASTFGAGDPPDNGEGFWQALQDNALNTISTLKRNWRPCKKTDFLRG
ncbi:flavodoxin domain-containing protein [Bacillus sp. OTU530]|uniref:flavodoxin domain-containing protein n=1 Tax=Bacillus sp. OTU530 TaxID=3043862 RepID=UPI00313C4707